MKIFLRYAASLLILSLINKSTNAQQYDNFYQASGAAMLQIAGNNHIEHTLKGATILFPNGSNQLNVVLNITYNAVYNKSIATGDLITPDYLLQLKINIDPDKIQQELTSTKPFFTHGSLSLNNITKEVTVHYIPEVSGTEEDGNFNVYLSVIFNAADFNLDEPSSNTQYVITINDGKVNRV